MWLMVFVLGCRSGAPTPDLFGPPPWHTSDSASPDDTAETGESGVEDTAPLRDAQDHIVRFTGDPPTNLLVLSVDTWRRDGTGYGSGVSGRSPFLDSLAHQGVVLRRHRSCSNWTLVSMMCAMSGQSTVDLGYHPMSSGVPLPEELRFMVEYLTDHGYVSAMANGNAILSQTGGFADGYQLYAGLQVEPAEVIVDNGMAMLDDLQASNEPGTPWLLHLHFMDPHIPYDPPEAYLGALEGLGAISYDLAEGDAYDAIRADFKNMDEAQQALVLDHLWERYIGSGRYMDDQIARLFDELTTRGALDDTLVVMFADHGEQFFEAGHLGHGATLQAQEVPVPALFWSHDIVPADVTLPTSHLDLAPTMLSAMGFAVPEEMTGEVIGDFGKDRYVIAWDAFEPRVAQVAITQEASALIYKFDGRFDYFRLDEDPEMLVDVLDRSDAEVHALWERLEPEMWRFAELLDRKPSNPSL